MVEAFFCLGETMAPMGIKLRWNQAGVMGPMFKERAALLMQYFQMLVAISIGPRMQDHMVGALDRVDAVELHVAQLVNEALQTVRIEGPSGGSPQTLPVQQE